MTNFEATLLAVDTCTEACSVALTVYGKVYTEEVDAPREHSQRLLPMIDTLLTKAGITIKDVDGIVYGRGPGSFTGIRICTSMVQGLALGQNIPVYGVSTLDAMAQQAADAGVTQIMTAIDARMGEVYWAQYLVNNNVVNRISDENVSAPDQIDSKLNNNQEVVVCGTGFDTYPELLSVFSFVAVNNECKFPKAEAMLKLAIAAWNSNLFTTVDELKPVYVRDKVTWKKLPGR
ncbi:tRNA (adenosine(37)-N6)-threonylcarbamoyltransferase complex dimerization subunit type 1 TsaB [Parashewanella spongiae]|uniref:tRNA threonylcarbamoyladenosine biosynthesis protein TsaB n=1 Tax=Parashewanella spongiae TaxID=342950 RepID=A0A3A6U4S8_9GAMM|nr:tRNA (adenosine(37)-N6)-threonylcarbamoyltransferase complex dimerization subunit type 1 TsaB [Parashewanella spongiae]MCL1076822.1 tRNA (adenosine(37)-N6)-threonylcarbamoyltransferase complex dimerization subunit type 1 TsaB [Parashewanella spongiae]RJY19191.1 tRNA (adenosine(37)-N6)-threonylcarbamoyltransferase complex dimerization subunit type 1 TsaB [Parashewanella spongiae]